MERVIAWLSTVGKSPSKTLDPSAQYDPTQGAEAFMSELFGPFYAWDTPKTNWTKDDYYNYWDLDRVEANTEYLSIIPDVFYPVPALEPPVKARSHLSLDFYDSMNRAERNIDKLRTSLHTPIGWEQVKTDWRSGQPFNYKDAARLEANLLRLHGLIAAIIDGFRYCGAVVCGDGGEL